MAETGGYVETTGTADRTFMRPNYQCGKPLPQLLYVYDYELDRLKAAEAERDRFKRALERIALLDEADGHTLTWEDASRAVAIACEVLGKHPSEIEDPPVQGLTLERA